jgi:hypothetical protein
MCKPEEEDHNARRRRWVSRGGSDHFVPRRRRHGIAECCAEPYCSWVCFACVACRQAATMPQVRRKKYTQSSNISTALDVAIFFSDRVHNWAQFLQWVWTKSYLFCNIGKPSVIWMCVCVCVHRGAYNWDQLWASCGQSSCPSCCCVTHQKPGNRESADL